MTQAPESAGSVISAPVVASPLSTAEQGSPTLLWHVYPLGALGADQTGSDRTCGATLQTLAEWLPQVASLGADTLLLGPIFASLAHGYDTVTHQDIDDRLGTIADFDALVTAASARGIGVILDGAFAYASRAFWRLTDPAEIDDPWFRRDAHGELIPWRVESLVTPDYGSVGFQSYVAEVMSTWLERGASGWRLDSSWSVPAAFWRKVLARVRESHPSAWFLGQVFDDDLPPVINRATYSSATEYALMHGTREWLAGGSVDRMLSTLRVHQHNCTRNPVHTFLGNHDFARVADVVDPQLVPAAFCILMTLPGIPGLYYGDELAVTSDWTQGGSDALLRPVMSPGTIDEASSPARGVLMVVEELGSFRHTNTWLMSADVQDIQKCDGALSYQVTGDDRSIQVYVNPTSEPVMFQHPERHKPALGDVRIHSRHRQLEIAPRGWAILESAAPA